MFIQSHLVLAQAIAGRMPSVLPKRLPLTPFLFGAIYPDLSINYNKISHDLRGALPVVQNLIHSVGSLHDSQVPSAKQTFEMGNICHFLCDFFCQAHNFDEYQSFVSHNRYELQMDFLIHFALLNPTFKMLPFKVLHTNSPQEVIDIIKKKHDQYLETPRDFMTDVKFAISCSNIVFMNLFNFMNNDIVAPAA